MSTLVDMPVSGPGALFVELDATDEVANVFAVLAGVCGKLANECRLRRRARDREAPRT